MTVDHKKIIAVWFSCGAASAVAAKKTIEKYKDTHVVRVINNPVKEEDTDNVRFLKDVEKWIGTKIEFCINERFPDCSAETVWKNRKYMSGIRGAPCTLELKKRARQQWERENKWDYLVMGFTYDEIDRHENFKLSERENILPVLIDERITKEDCFKILNEAGIRLPELYHKGFPNANCIGCVKATSPDYWNLVRKEFPDIFNERAKMSRGIGCRLTRYKGKRIFLDELPVCAKGRGLKKMKNIECGIFCEERTNQASM